MDKKKSKYLVHPSNDMLLSAKILKDINGLKTNRLGNNWLVGLGVALLCSIVFLNFANEKFPFGIFSINQTSSDPSVTVSSQKKMVKTGYEGPLFTQSEPTTEMADPKSYSKLAKEAAQNINFNDFSELRNGKSKYSRLNEIEIASLYTQSGIWPKVPLQAQPPSNVPLGDVYITSIDPSVLSLDAIALDKANTVSELKALLDIRSPLSIGSSFKLDENGLAIATKVGTLAPAGHQVFSGNPDVVPPVKPIPNYLSIGEKNVNIQVLSKLRPKPRPADKTPDALIAAKKRELAEKKPRLRPNNIEISKYNLASLSTSSINFKGLRVKPKERPSGLSMFIDQALGVIQYEGDEANIAGIVPDVPSSPRVTKKATIQNVLNLRRTNLIGVYGNSKSRRALVRLSNGKRQMVTVGDTIDGGKVAAIGESELRYIKSGKNITLKVPQG